MSDDDAKETSLRQQALHWLERKAPAGRMTEVTAQSDPTAMLEELRIYQAELEVQNEELRLGRQEAELARNYYSSLFNLLPILAFVLDERGLILEANQQAKQVLGFASRLNLRQHALYRLMAEASATLLAESLRSVSTEQGQTDFDLLHLRAGDGRLLSMTGSLANLPAAAGLKRQYLLLLMDRTVEIELNAQLHLYETIVNQTKSLIYAHDADDRTILINDTAISAVGLPREQIVGRLREDYTPSAQAELYAAHDRQVWETRKAIIFEETFDPPEGGRVWLLTQRFPLFDEDGKMIAVGGISTDITAIKTFTRKQELALKVFSQGSDGIMIADAEGQIETVNAAFTAMTGIPETDAIGVNMLAFLSSRHSPAFLDNLWQHLNATGQWEGELWIQDKDGDDVPVWLRLSQVTFEGEHLTYQVGSFSDLRERKLADREIERLAFHDQLTGLANRYLLRDRLEQLLRYSDRSGGTFWVVFFDLDRFKSVNDDYGHEAGDFVLKEAAHRLKAHVRDSDTLARLGGDEFVWVAEDMPLDIFSRRLTDVLKDLAQPYVYGHDTMHLSASVGVSSFPLDGTSFDALMNAADLAMYEAKEGGGNAIRFFNSKMSEDLQSRHLIENRLRGAISRNDFALVYQPIVEMKTLRIRGVEALLRWHDAKLGVIPPDVFIPIAERMGLLDSIGDWVLEEVCRQILQWQHLDVPEISISMNVSARQFFQPDFVERVRHVLHKHAIPPRRVEIELTERIAMENAEQSIKIMRALKAEGIRLAIDDFGTGYSSLSYLRWMPVDVLKIDKSFVSDLGSNKDSEIVCESIINLAKALSLTVLSEGIETEAQFRFLKQAGCELMQGYLLSPPLSGAELLPVLTGERRLGP